MVNGSVNEILQNGDSLFSREYAYQAGCQNYFMDLVQATDKGYCFSGFFSPIFANGCSGSQDVWLLKVDSNFCENNTTCYAGMAPQAYVMGLEVNLFPNPTNSLLNIETEQELKTITIYNSLGAEMVYKTLSPKSIDVSSFSSGVYFLIIKTSSGIVRKKFVKE